MTSDRYVAALDAGIGGGRCLLLNAAGDVAGTAYREWDYIHPADIPGGCEFAPDRFWALLCAATREAIARAGIPPTAVRAISATSMREGFVLLDAQGREIHATAPLDRRGLPYAARLAEARGPEIHAITGLIPGALHPPAVMQWLGEHRPAVLDAAASFLMISDWLLYRLSGAQVTEPSNACTSLLFDVAARCWSQPLVASLGFDGSLFPPVVESGTVVGELGAVAAEAMGLRPGIPIVAGGGDAQCGLLGIGAARPETIGAVAGTTTPVLVTTALCRFDPTRRTATRCHVLPGRWNLEANAGITGLSLRWLRDVLFPAHGRATSYDAMVAVATMAPVGAGGVMSLIGPSVAGSRRTRMGGGRGAFVNLDIGKSGEETRAALVRALLEGVCFAVAANGRLLGEAVGVPLTTLYLGGGQARSPFWCQIQADVLDAPVYAATVGEASAYGAAICAGAGIGMYADLASWEPTRTSYRCYEPRPEVVRAYAPVYGQWLDEYRHLAA